MMECAMLKVVFLVLMVGCRDNKIADDETQEWWESESETQKDEDSEDSEEEKEDKDETSGTDEDKPLEDIEDCPEDFDAQASCEGSWETTICYYNSMIWWCEEGVWLNEEDK